MTKSRKNEVAGSATAISEIDTADPWLPTCVKDIPWPADPLDRFQGAIDAFLDPQAKNPEGLLFVGHSGAGKTTAIRYFLEAVDADSVWINANERDGNIDVKRVIADAGPVSLLGKRNKIIVIDEACSCTVATLKALRGETMTLGVPIILIANDLKAFPAAVQSRCEVFMFDESIAEEMKDAQRRRALEVVKATGVEIPAATVNAIIDSHLPDFRVAARKLDAAIREVKAGREIVLPKADVVALQTQPLTKAELAEGTSELLAELVGTIERHLVLRPGAAVALALFVLHAYAHDAANHSPILAVTAPERDCGKSAVIMLLWCLIEKAEQIIQPTGAGLYSLVDKGIPCLMDEADEYLTKNRSDLLTVLNSGFTRGAGSVARYNASHQCWGIKVIGQIGPIVKDTLASRCIAIEMDRKQEDQIREEVTPDLRETFDGLRLRLREWAIAAHANLRLSKPDIPNAMNRLADKWRAMLAIGDLAGDTWSQTSRKAMTMLEVARPVQPSMGTELLVDLKDAFDNRGGEIFLSDDMVAHLNALPDKNWARRLGQSPQAEIARILSQYRSSDHRDNGGPIAPRRQSQIGNNRRRGYHRLQFDDAFASYVPPASTVSASTPPKPAAKGVAKASAKRKPAKKKGKPTKKKAKSRK